MEDTRDREFLPVYLFLVTGFSFALFALMLHLIGSQNTSLFWWISGTSFIFGTLTGIYVSVTRENKRKKRMLHETINGETSGNIRHHTHQESDAP